MSHIKLNGHKKRFTLILGASLVIIVPALLAGGYTIYQSKLPKKAIITGSPAAIAQTGQEIVVSIKIDTQNYTINAAEVYLHFDPSQVQVTAVGKDASLFQLWLTDEPKFSNKTGIISFAGGLPTPGFKGNGQIGTVTLRVVHPGKTKLTFDPKTRVLLNDGKGTAVPLQLPPIEVQTN